jgi:hypothetical protein
MPFSPLWGVAAGQGADARPKRLAAVKSTQKIIFVKLIIKKNTVKFTNVYVLCSIRRRHVF